MDSSKFGGNQTIQVPQVWGTEGAAKLAINFTIHRAIQQRLNVVLRLRSALNSLAS
jgi:hypothetical protein